MPERSPIWQAVNALLLALIVLVMVLVSAWFMERVTIAFMGRGGLPSTLGPQQAYVLTLLTAVFGLLAGAAVMVGLNMAKHLARRASWLVYFLIGAPLLALLFAPLQRSGAEPFLGLPSFLVSVPGRSVIAVAMGAMIFSSLDLRRVAPLLMLESVRVGSKKVSPASNTVKGLPGRFTPQAWRALSNMQEEAQRFEHAYMGTEHLLMGMLRDGRSQGTKVVVNLGGNPAEIRGQLEGVIGRRGSLYTGASGMTRRCQRVIESAARLARASNQRTVSTGHLLHALVEEPEDLAAQLLEQAGVSADRVAAELRHLGPEGE